MEFLSPQTFLLSKSAATSGTFEAHNSFLTAAPTANSTGIFVAGNDSVSSGSGNNFNNNIFIGRSSNTFWNSTGTLSQAIGLTASTRIGAAGVITTGYGIQGQIIASAGTVTNGYALYGGIPSSGGTVTNGYGCYVDTVNATNKWGIYQVDPTLPNVLAGFTTLRLATDARAANTAGAGSLRWNSSTLAPQYSNGTQWIDLMSQTAVATATVTRAANVTAYAANDVVGSVLTFSSLGQTGNNRIAIANLDVIYNIAAVASGMNFRLYLYSASPPSAYTDNAAWDLPSGDRSVYLGYIDIGTPQDLGSTLVSQIDAINKILALTSADLYCYLVTLSAFTPAANSETYTARLYSSWL